MMRVTHTRRTREFTGPTPHSVAVKARPTNTRPPEYLILERRKKEENLQEAEAQTNYMKVCNLKNDWEKTTDRRIQQNTVKRRVQSLLQAEQFSIEERRGRLRELLSQEETQYLREMDAMQETVIERQSKMRERAKFLKEKRETERLDFVQQKLDQQFRNQCEELRSTLSKRQQDEVCVERLEQLRIKEAQEFQRQREEDMYAQLWEQDMLEKAAREERDSLAQHERNKDVLETLRMQMAALEKQKAEGSRLKEEEAQLLREQAAIRKLEERRALEEKIEKQTATREMLDMSLRVKMKKRAKDEQEQLAFELKMLEQLLEESRNEAMEQVQRKKELREEDRRYREYLRRMLEEERAKEKELEKLINEEVEKTWQKRLLQWKLEHDARKKLLQDVLAARAIQVQDRLLENGKKQIVAQKEREELSRTIEENKRLEEDRLEQIHTKNSRYQSDLGGQIRYNSDLRSKERDREEEEYRLGFQAEREYQEKIKEVLDNPFSGMEKMHPMRRQIYKNMMNQNQ